MIKQKREIKQTLQQAEKETGIIKITPETIKKFICPLASDQEIVLFLNQCKMFSLNPFKREIYLIKYAPNQAANFVVGYEVYLKRAERSQKWAGLETAIEGTLQEETLKAKVKVYRKDWDRPLCHEVDFSEYAQYTKEGLLTKFWKDKPITMLKKVAIGQALRMAFPDEMAGLPYMAEEQGDIRMERLPDGLSRFTEETEEDREKIKAAEEKIQKEKEEREQDEEPLTPAQKTEFDRIVATLVDKYQYDPGELLAEIKKRFAVESPDDMNTIQAATAIVFLKRTTELADQKRKNNQGQKGTRSRELF